MFQTRTPITTSHVTTLTLHSIRKPYRWLLPFAPMVPNLAMSKDRDRVIIPEHCSLCQGDDIQHTGRLDRMLHRKWRETKRQPNRAGSGHQISCCLVSLRFLCDILSGRPVCIEEIAASSKKTRLPPFPCILPVTLTQQFSLPPSLFADFTLFLA